MGTFPTDDMELTCLLVVFDVDRSRAWYTDVLGATVFREYGSYVPAYWTCHIVSVRRDGTGLRTIVGGTWHPVEPVVSPDGSSVAYVSDKGGYDARLWLVDADGSDPRTIGPTFGVERLSWAPDGSRIAFTGDFRNGAIHTIAPDGSDLEVVVPDAIFPPGRRTDDGSSIGASEAATWNGRASMGPTSRPW